MSSEQNSRKLLAEPDHAVEPPKLVAIDSEVLLGLSMGLTDHGKAMDFFRKKVFVPIVTPTVLTVVQSAVEAGTAWADRVLQDVWDSDCVKPRYDNDTYREVLKIHALRLLEQELLPNGELADALILAEASYFGAQALLTISRPLRDADANSLKVALLDCGLHPIAVTSPRQIVTYLERKEAMAQAAAAALSPVAI